MMYNFLWGPVYSLCCTKNVNKNLLKLLLNKLCKWTSILQSKQLFSGKSSMSLKSPEMFAKKTHLCESRRKPPTMQDGFWPTQGFITCAGVMRMWRVLSHARKAVTWLPLWGMILQMCSFASFETTLSCSHVEVGPLSPASLKTASNPVEVGRLSPHLTRDSSHVEVGPLSPPLNHASLTSV